MTQTEGFEVFVNGLLHFHLPWACLQDLAIPNLEEVTFTTCLLRKPPHTDRKSTSEQGKAVLAVKLVYTAADNVTLS